jgi:hypothetical protein
MTGSHGGHAWRTLEHWRRRLGIGQSRLLSRHAAGSATTVFCVTASQHRVGGAARQVNLRWFAVDLEVYTFQGRGAATTWCPMN